jgi:hypothetical protein
VWRPKLLDAPAAERGKWRISGAAAVAEDSAWVSLAGLETAQ